MITIPIIFSPVTRRVGDWYPPYLAFSAVIGLAAMIGLWMMKKWSIILYTALVAMNQVVLLATVIWNISVLLIPAIVIAVGFSQYSKMD